MLPILLVILSSSAAGMSVEAQPSQAQFGREVRAAWLDLRGLPPTDNEVAVAALCWAVKEQLRDRELRSWFPGQKPIKVEWPLDDRFERFAALDLCGVLPTGVTTAHLRRVWLDLYGLPLTMADKEKAAVSWLKFRGK